MTTFSILVTLAFPFDHALVDVMLQLIRKYYNIFPLCCDMDLACVVIVLLLLKFCHGETDSELADKETEMA